MNLEVEIAKKLLQINAIKLNMQNPFLWASGIKSPIYCDNRITLSYPDVRMSIKHALGQLVRQFDNVSMISGVATAGIAHGALLADFLNLPFSYVRSAPKGHGRQNQIEGEIRSDDKIVVVEDLISTGGSSIEVVNILRENGFEVLGVIAIFDYNFEQSKKNFEQINCKYSALSNYPVLLKQALESKYILESEFEILSKWSEDPKNWFEKYF